MKSVAENPVIIKARSIAHAQKGGNWKRVLKLLERGKRQRAEVNLSKASKFASSGLLLIPGKLLADGEAAKGMQVACLQYSEKAREKVEKAGGKVFKIQDAVGKKFTLVI
jgi:large subunit ribosomal protein L18e